MTSNTRGPFYRRWTWIRQAINNPNSPDHYYAKDLDFDWMDDYFEFEEYILKHLGHPPADKTYLNRRNQTKGWIAGNLYWASGQDMGNNHPGYNQVYRYKGNTQTISNFSRMYGINKHTLGKRLQRGWTIKEALETPPYTKISHKNTASYGKNTNHV